MTDQSQPLPPPPNVPTETRSASAPANLPKPGQYPMKAIEAELGFTKGSETDAPKPQVAVLLEFEDGPYAGTSLTWYGFFTEKTKQSTIRALRTLGWVGDDISDLSSVRGSAPCTVNTEPDLEGIPRARVRFIGAGSLALATTMTVDQKLAFAESMKAFAASVAAPPPKAEAKTEVKAPEVGKKFF